MRHALLPLLAAAMLTSCNGLFDDIYDELPADASDSDGFYTSTTQPDRITLKIDASDFGKWYYVSLKNMTVEERAIPLACEGDWDGLSGITYNEVHGSEFTYLSSAPADSQSEPDEWDFAVHRFDVRTHGGSVSETSLCSLDAISGIEMSQLRFTPDEWSTSQVMIDLTDMMAYRIGYQNCYVNPVLSAWVKMDISTPPPTYQATGHVYIMRLADGSMTALHLRSYMSERGEKGYLTIDMIYPWK